MALPSLNRMSHLHTTGLNQAMIIQGLTAALPHAQVIAEKAIPARLVARIHHAPIRLTVLLHEAIIHAHTAPLREVTIAVVRTAHIVLLPGTTTHPQEVAMYGLHHQVALHQAKVIVLHQEVVIAEVVLVLPEAVLLPGVALLPEVVAPVPAQEALLHVHQEVENNYLINRI